MHPAHYDADALVTAVLELDTCVEAAGSGAVPGGRGFSGPGFYVQALLTTTYYVITM